MEPQSRVRRKSCDANTRIPETLTSYLRESILALDGGPETAYLKSECFSKYVSEDTDPPRVRRQRAINKWLATERNNEATNVRLRITPEDFNILPRVAYGQFIDTVRRFIIDVIGEVPDYDGLFGGFSGGATTSRKRTEGHPARKYLGQADVTKSAWVWIEDLLRESPLWSGCMDRAPGDPEGHLGVRFVRGNVLFTVAKTTEIDRCACKEPDLNMYLQRGLGNQIRKALKRKGIDLNDQLMNKELAQLGSDLGTLATLDLSSASDSISYELVAMCLPDMWFSLLNACRSPITVIDGEEHVNEMFSSMGNGFTFELESLLFYAFARAVAFHTNTPGVISVYGDDIIVPSEIALDLSYVLGFLGFEVNTKKSFWTGPFRESCGGHYHNGLDITPFYVKAPLRKLVDLIHVCNQLRKWAGLNSWEILDPRVETLWAKLAAHVPKRFWGGHDLSDKTRLVSRWVPRKPYRLVIDSRKKRLSEGGRYLLWLDAATSRLRGITDDVIRDRAPLGTFTAQRAGETWRRELVPCFPSEITGGATAE